MAFDFNQALINHAEWRLRFLALIEKGESVNITPDICKADGCELGKWLTGPGGAMYKLLGSHRTCSQAHASFHEEMNKVARLINTKQGDEARKQLREDTAYTKAFAAFVRALKQFKQENKL